MLRFGIRLSVAVATFLLGLAISAVTALSPWGAPAASSSVFEREVLETNREYLEAHMSRDVAALDRLLADEFTVGGRYGRWANKAQRLAMLSDSDLVLRYVDGEGVRVVAGEQAGEVSGSAVLHGSYMGREFTSPPYRYVRRFERRDGGWQVVGVEIFRGR